jgi:epoxide hydrolase-like predicted phosphatase
MIKAFLFDNGGVMTSGGAGNELAERLANNLGINEVKAWSLLKQVFDEYIKGKLTEPELWRIVENHYGKPISVDKRDIWNKWEDMRPLPEMMDLVRKLKTKGYKVGLLSNVIPNTERVIRANGGYDNFDFLVLSCEVGFSKPDPEIYAIAMNHLDGIKPNEVAFLDDQERCLVPARELGMETILVNSPTQAIAEVQKLL